MPHQTELILLTGFSGRMMAELAVKAGYPVMALDYFGDFDLQQLCRSVSLRHNFNLNYSAAALADAAATLPGAAVVYGASLENHPAEVARLAKNRKLLGNPPAALRRVRNPFLLAKTLQIAGFAMPETLPAKTPPIKHTHVDWLWKPLHGGGGLGVTTWPGPLPQQPGILQQRLPGMVGSMSFVANGREAVLLAVTEQLPGSEAFFAPGFKYGGNLLPPRLPAPHLARLLDELARLAAHLTRSFGLWGINGVDFVWHQERAWTLEVNPRISASLELTDLLFGIDSFAMHVQSFSGQLPDFNLSAALAASAAAGKAIVYAPQDILLGDTSGWPARGIKDVPHPGEQIEQGHPVCTILASAGTPDNCLHQLQAQAAQLTHEFRAAV